MCCRRPKRPCGTSNNGLTLPTRRAAPNGTAGRSMSWRLAQLGLSLALGVRALVSGYPAAAGEPTAEAPVPASPADEKGTGREPVAADKLPWEKTPSKHPAPLLHPIASPREFLDKYGIGESQWAG